MEKHLRQYGDFLQSYYTALGTWAKDDTPESTQVLERARENLDACSRVSRRSRLIAWWDRLVIRAYAWCHPVDVHFEISCGAAHSCLVGLSRPAAREPITVYRREHPEVHGNGRMSAGFSLIELSFTMLVFCILSAISIPIVSRSFSVQPSPQVATGHLHQLQTALYPEPYIHRAGYPASLNQLATDGLLTQCQVNSHVGGYSFTYTQGQSDSTGRVLSYSITATPDNPNFPTLTLPCPGCQVGISQ